jgi:hypothetical protein
MNLKTGMIALALVGALGTRPASALIWYGDPVVGSSWSQGFHEGPVDHDFWRIDLISGGPFESPAIRNFSTVGWALVWDHPTSASAAGPVVADSFFDIFFELTPSDPLSFHFAAYNGGNLVGTALASHDANGWVVDNDPGWNPGLGDPVSEPATLMLLGSGLFGAGLAAWRRRKT